MEWNFNMENFKDKKTDDIVEKLVHINRITKVVCEISKSQSVPAWAFKDSTADLETTWHVGGQIKEDKENDRTISHMGQEGGQ